MSDKLQFVVSRTEPIMKSRERAGVQSEPDQRILEFVDDELKLIGHFPNMPFNETIFVTGFPGFIATRLVKRLAAEGARFILLSQPALLATAQGAATNIASETGIDIERFRIVEGDITKPNLGLSEAELAEARRETMTVFHLAAIYDLEVAEDVATRVNVAGTRNVNDFVKSIEQLKRYHYVSTCYVAGKREGLIKENELAHHAGFRNHYEETKYAAETTVEALKSELPVTIHRPAVVCGDSHTGETAKYDGIYYLIHYLRKWPAGLTLLNIGNSEVRLNLVPVDFVIDAMVALAKDDRAIGATVQLADPAPLTTHQLFNEISKAIRGRDSFATVPAGIVYPVLRLPLAPKLTGLPHSAVPYFFLEQTYDTTRARELLEPHGIRCPGFPEYVGALVNFVAEHPRLR
ncbi:MAG TPA: SDR family oxidoreductase [Pyrinomonadaceae bacterium]|nr:SDR family oxidoreductase [Pyrinomonadaceae bacterium]